MPTNDTAAERARQKLEVVAQIIGHNGSVWKLDRYWCVSKAALIVAEIERLDREVKK